VVWSALWQDVNLLFDGRKLIANTSRKVIGLDYTVSNELLDDLLDERGGELQPNREDLQWFGQFYGRT